MRSIVVNSNHSLKSLSGLENIPSSLEGLLIQANLALTNLTGLENLTTAWFVSIVGNRLLTDLEGLENLTTVEVDLKINYNFSLTSLSGLNNLTNVGFNLFIRENPSLTTLAGIDNLSTLGSLYIQTNDALSNYCALYGLINGGGLSGSYNVADNHVNPTRQDIIDGGPCNSPPVAVCQSVTVLADENCQAMVTASEIDNGSADPDGDVISLSISPEGPYGIGVTNVTLTVDDGRGETATCEATVTVEDDMPPVITCPADVTLECPADISIAATGSATATDACDQDVTITSSDVSVSGCGNTETITRTWTATDECGNQTSANQTIKVIDEIPPVFSEVPDEIVQENDPGECGATVVFPAINADDNCQADVVQSFEPASGSFFPVGTTTVSAAASDACGNTRVEHFDVIVSDTQLPTIEAPTDVVVTYDPTICGATVTFSDPVYSDNCGDLILERTDGAGLISGDLFPVGTITIGYVVTDPSGNAASASFSVTIENQPPVLSNLVVPLDPVAVGTSVSVSLDFEDDNLTDAIIDWGDGNQSDASIGQGVIMGEYAYSIPGVYALKVQVIDACGEEVSLLHEYIVIYDPEGGFVTGGGWIFSPEGAYKPDPLLTGKANFGFVSKYKKGSSVPDGNTEFQFKAGNLNFKSTDYEWLVIAGSKAMFKGSGTINGFGIYGFMLSAIDADLTPSADVDKFRIKIWDKEDDIVVYDNNLEIDDNADPTTEIGGGSIIIHTSKTKSAEIETGLFTKTENTNISVYPNPFNDRLYFDFNSPKDVRACIDIFDVTGRKVKSVFYSFIKGGVNYHAEFIPESEVNNLYFYQIKLGEEVFYGKIVYSRR
jgi:hypothetical protein